MNPYNPTLRSCTGSLLVYKWDGILYIANTGVTEAQPADSGCTLAQPVLVGMRVVVAISRGATVLPEAQSEGQLLSKR